MKKHFWGSAICAVLFWFASMHNDMMAHADSVTLTQVLNHTTLADLIVLVVLFFLVSFAFDLADILVLRLKRKS